MIEQRYWAPLFEMQEVSSSHLQIRTTFSLSIGLNLEPITLRKAAWRAKYLRTYQA